MSAPAINPIIIERDEWEDTYRPVENEIQGGGTTMFETFGAELDFVKSEPIECVWTVLEVEDKQIVAAGFHLVNRIGYMVTEKPWANPHLEVHDD